MRFRKIKINIQKVPLFHQNYCNGVNEINLTKNYLKWYSSDRKLFINCGDSILTELNMMKVKI